MALFLPFVVICLQYTSSYLGRLLSNFIAPLQEEKFLASYFIHRRAQSAASLYSFGLRLI